GGTTEDIAFRVTFTEPGDTGQQQVRVLRADGPAAREATAGTLLGEGRTGEVFSLTGDGLAWAGLAADPFTADGVAIVAFNQALNEGRYAPEVFTTAPSNALAGRDVTAIALQLPDDTLGSARIGLWGRINLADHVPQRQVNRIGQAMFRPLFFNPAGSEEQLDALNAAPPAADRDTCTDRVRRIAGTAARLAGLPDPDGHAAAVAAAFLPDVLTYRPGQPAGFHPAEGNGRALGDNAFDTAVAVLAGSALANASIPRHPTPPFPYLSPAPPPPRPPAPPPPPLPPPASTAPVRPTMTSRPAPWQRHASSAKSTASASSRRGGAWKTPPTVSNPPPGPAGTGPGGHATGYL